MNLGQGSFQERFIGAHFCIMIGPQSLGPVLVVSPTSFIGGVGAYPCGGSEVGQTVRQSCVGPPAPPLSSVQFQLCGLEIAPISSDGRGGRNCFEREAVEGEGEGEVAYPFFAHHKWRRKWFLRLTDCVGVGCRKRGEREISSFRSTDFSKPHYFSPIAFCV